MKFLHTVFLFVELALHRIQKPLFDQSFFIAAVRKKLGEARLLKVDFLNNIFPLSVIDLILFKLIKILSGLRAVVHVITVKFQRIVFLVRLKKLTALAVAFQNKLFILFLNHRHMIKILRTSAAVLADKADHLKPVVIVILRKLAPAHHHAHKAVSCTAV